VRRRGLPGAAHADDKPFHQRNTIAIGAAQASSTINANGMTGRYRVVLRAVDAAGNTTTKRRARVA
jgi:hypothetical protein